MIESLDAVEDLQESEDEVVIGITAEDRAIRLIEDDRASLMISAGKYRHPEGEVLALNEAEDA